MPLRSEQNSSVGTARFPIGTAAGLSATGALFRLIVQYTRHSMTMRLQLRVERCRRELHEVRCQAQALEVALLVAFGIGHVHLQEGASGRTPSRVLSVVHTTERTHSFVVIGGG
jgi:hypothetical protein